MEEHHSLSSGDGDAGGIYHELLANMGLNLNELHITPFQRLRYIGSGGGETSEPALEDNICEYEDSGFDKLLSIEFRGVENVRHIPDEFVGSSQLLTHIDISLFRSVTTIGCAFLFGCSSLTSIDLSVLINITEVRSFFLAECASLTSIDLTPLSNVTNIKAHFMSGCTSLTSIDLRPFSYVTSIGTDFMAECTALESIDLTPLVSMKSLPASSR